VGVVSWIGDAITIGREVGSLGLEVFRSVREARRQRGRTQPVTIPEVDSEIERRAAARWRRIDDRFPEA
jgi:hypothetical protein